MNAAFLFPVGMYEEPFSKRVKGAIVFSGAGLEITGSFFQMIRPKSPVSLVEGGIAFNIKEIEKDVFYQFEYENEKQAIRITRDGMLETYDVM